MSHALIIDELSVGEVAKRMMRPRAHVRVWKHRGIPRSVWAEMIDTFPSVTLERLRGGDLHASSIAVAATAGAEKLRQNISRTDEPGLSAEVGA